jgi:hypothetical protein
MSLIATAAIACGAIYLVLNGTPPAERPVKAEAPTRSLAYENAIARTSEPAQANGDAAQPETTSAAPNVAVADPKPEPNSAPKAEPAPAAQGTGNAATGEDAAMPPSEDEEAAADEDAPQADEQTDQQGYEPLPWQQHAARPDAAQPDYGAMPGQDANGYGEDGQPQGEHPYGQANADPYGQPPADPYQQGNADPYGAPPRDPYAQGSADPYGQPPADPYGDQANADPNAVPYGNAPQGPSQNGEEWVQVQISGSAMRSAASDDAPMLFAFPYGRNLRVVSRYGDWVEVADPKSAATGWMKAATVAPSAGPAPPGYEQAYDPSQDYQDEQRKRRRLFNGGFADMINRAFGGHN